jgi:hypothetical protein
MSWLKSILAILSSLFKVVDKKTLSYEEKVDKINRDKKEQIKDDWKDTQNEIDRAFRVAKSRNRMQDSKSE